MLHQIGKRDVLGQIERPLDLVHSFLAPGTVGVADGDGVSDVVGVGDDAGVCEGAGVTEPVADALGTGIVEAVLVVAVVGAPTAPAGVGSGVGDAVADGVAVTVGPSSSIRTSLPDTSLHVCEVAR